MTRVHRGQRAALERDAHVVEIAGLKQAANRGRKHVVVDLIAGNIELAQIQFAQSAPLVKAGKLRCLGVTSTQRTPLLPDIPTVAEQGLPGYEIMPWSGYVVPKQTPSDIVRRLNAELNKALFSPTVSERMAAIGSMPVGGTPEQFGEHVRRETAKWAKVIKASGARPE